MILWACSELLKRYKTLPKVNVENDVIIDALAVVMSKQASGYQKKAARMALDYVYGIDRVNKLIEDIAVVTDRNDRLVRQWRKKVIARDKYCVKCGETKNLHAHHISHWADDPINRINVNNGITLCKKCHSEEHYEIRHLILGGV